MKKLVTPLFFLISTLTALAQPCQFVEITTTPLIVLPECGFNDGSVIFTNTQGGTSPYNYSLNGSSNQLGSFGNLTVGEYDIIITDSRGCRDTFLIDLTYRNIEDIIRPDNAFTPNDDGVNDTWYIPAIESFKGSEVRVFNRWGQEVHQNSEYTNMQGWDGTQNGSKLPAATYYFVISIINNCVEEQLKGTVTILR